MGPKSPSLHNDDIADVRLIAALRPTRPGVVKYLVSGQDSIE